MSFSGTKGYLTKPKPGVMINPLHPLSKGLVGYWLFNEGTGSRAYDISGKGNHGTLTNMSPNAQNSGWGGSKFRGGGLKFDGVNDYVDIPLLSQISNSNNFTISGIFNSNDVNANNGLFHNSSSANNRIMGLIYTGTLRFAAYDGVSALYVSSSTISSNITYHFAYVYTNDITGRYAKLYLNGLSQTGTGSTGTVAPSGAGIGKAYNTYFKGLIDYVTIYNRALLTAEVKQLYQYTFCNLLQVLMRRYSAPPVGAIMNQFQGANIGADLYNGAIIV